MANTLRFKRGLVSGIPTAALGEPLFTTDTFDLYIGNGTTNTRFQKYIASGTTSQLLRGDGSLLTMPIVLTSPSNGQVLKYNGTSWVNDSDSGITGSGTTNYLPKFTGASTLGNSTIFDDGTNVGIGTNTPKQRFEILGLNGNIRLYGEGGVANNNLSSNVFYNGTIWTRDNTSLGAVSLVLNPSGVFSVHTTSNTTGFPDERFKVTATGNFIINNATTDNGLRFQVTGDGYFSGSVGIGASTLTTSLTLGSGTTGLSFQSANTTLNSGKIAVIRPIEVGSGNGHLVFETYQGGSGGGERMRLDSSGNLGLGVVPSAWSGYGVPVIEMPSGGTFIGQGSVNIGSNWYYSGSSFLYKTSSNASYYSQNSGQHRWYNAPSGTAGNAITFTQAMTLDASGRLGIGTASPTAPLHVVGTNVIIQQYTGSPNTFAFGQYDVSGNASINNLANANLLFATNNTERARLSSGGNLLVGTTTDSGLYKLDVNGTMRVSGASTFNAGMTLTTGVQSIFTLASTDTNGRTWTLNTAGTTYYGSGAGSFVLRNNGVDALVFNASSAATFSSSVTAASFIPTSSTIPTNGMYLSAANTLAFATASGNKLTISSTGLATFTDSARFSNLKGCIFVQTGGSLLGSISMDSSNQVTIDNNGFFGLSVGSNYTMTGGNLGIGHSSFGTSATRTISVINGTAPSTSPTDSFQIYSNDVVAGNAAPHIRTENGAIIKLYQETTAVGNSTISVGGGNAVLDDTEFDGYTLRQIVRALRNQGILQ